ncbi:MAG: phosphopantetheine-binding protein [Synergistaceae bacterium]|jgi:acyl carrier protein|nr:phosphopantetheine-binding protein [Synergistaceae bacterium]MDD4438744.1 phosphopantetheine-binding protein [Tissierellia bacterium]
MENKVLEIINKIREAKNLQPVSELQITDNLREDLELTSFDLAELTVNLEDEYDIDIFEDGLVNTVGEIYKKLQN